MRIGRSVSAGGDRAMVISRGLPLSRSPVCFNTEPDAEDEKPFRRQEALQEDRHRQAPGPSRLLQSHSGEKVAEAEAENGETGRHLPERRTEGAEAAGGQVDGPRQALRSRAQEAPQGSQGSEGL